MTAPATPPQAAAPAGAANSDDRFTMDVLREGFAAISDEMFVSLQRTSQSPIIYEVLDFAVGVTDTDGDLVAQGNGIAGFLGPLGDAVKEILARGIPLRPGDVIIANDPYAGGGTHLSDVALVRPVFSGPELIGFAAAKGHWTEVGGKDPGSWTADSQDVYAEGLQLPFVHAYSEGMPNTDLRAILAANSRLPEMVLGDLTAQAACLEVAERRLLEMCARYGTATVRSAMRAVLDRSERLCRDLLAKIPHGTFTAEDLTDTDGLGNGPFAVKVRVEVSGDSVTCDFTGSHAQVPGPINCTWSGLASGVRTVFKAITGPAEPATDGWFRPLTIIAPSGCIFNATRPAPVAAYFEATEMASDLVWHALAPAFPERLPAGTYVSVCSTSLALTHPDTGEPTLLVEPQPGGWGAGRDADGQHALISVGDGETYVIPVEVAEQRYGVRVERMGFDIVPGAGAGRRRGGRGLVREYRICCEDALLTVAWGRHLYPPWGAAGGRNGSPNYVEVLRDGRPVGPRFGKVSRMPLRRDDVVRLVTGSGGGYGDPRDREPERVAADLRAGLVTAQETADYYGRESPSELVDKSEIQLDMKRKQSHG
jgi:N-methylhydantoinase B